MPIRSWVSHVPHSHPTVVSWKSVSSGSISHVSMTFLDSLVQLLWGTVSLPISVDLSLLLGMFLEKFRRCLILLSYLAPYVLLPKLLPWPFLLHWCTRGPQPPSRPQWFLGDGRLLISIGLCQPKLFCDYVLSARNAFSKQEFSSPTRVDSLCHC